jgi:hypothetical protein
MRRILKRVCLKEWTKPQTRLLQCVDHCGEEDPFRGDFIRQLQGHNLASLFGPNNHINCQEVLSHFRLCRHGLATSIGSVRRTMLLIATRISHKETKLDGLEVWATHQPVVKRQVFRCFDRISFGLSIQISIHFVKTPER